MNISEQELLSMLEEAYQSGYEGYFEQMTANCYAIVQKYKDENKHLAQSQNAELNSANLSVQATSRDWYRHSIDNPYVSFVNSETDHYIQIGETHSAGTNRNGDDFSNVQINSIPENVSIQHTVPNVLSYTL
jgi:predicted SPOUT superfamily RNA methylase MTH1